jgi:hypothetical protein
MALLYKEKIWVLWWRQWDAGAATLGFGDGWVKVGAGMDKDTEEGNEVNEDHCE